MMALFAESIKFGANPLELTFPISMKDKVTFINKKYIFDGVTACTIQLIERHVMFENRAFVILKVKPVKSAIFGRT